MSPAGVVGAHGDEHVEDERGQIRLIHHCLPCGQETPLQLRNSLQGAPAIHALSPAACLCCEDTGAPELLHLYKWNAAEKIHEDGGNKNLMDSWTGVTSRCFC